MKILYVGKNSKEYKVDSIVGLSWREGEIKDVTPQLAEKLLPYSDTWVEVKGDTREPTDKRLKANKPVEVPKENLIDLPPRPQVDRSLPVINYGIMDKDAVVAHIRLHYNEDLNVNKPLQEIRQDALAVQTRMENWRIDEEEENERKEIEADAKLKEESEVIKAVKAAQK